VVLLSVGGALHLWRPLPLFQAAWPPHAFGWPLMLAGVLLAAWAVRAVNDVDTRAPASIIDSGPYAHSRNPMYVAWTMIYLAAALLANTWWLIILLPILALFTHYFVVRKEESALERRFGEQYLRYRARVRRYI
jgi:protein-S-isoprenylcysteine O-methyltransferase Ste14